MGNVWKLQDARDHFSEVVRRAQQDGPQTITVHGRERAVLLSCEDYRRLRPGGDDAPRTGLDLLRFFQESPLAGIDLDIERDRELPPDPIELPD